jgi:hypothetical protein
MLSDPEGTYSWSSSYLQHLLLSHPRQLILVAIELRASPFRYGASTPLPQNLMVERLQVNMLLHDNLCPSFLIRNVLSNKKEQRQFAVTSLQQANRPGREREEDTREVCRDTGHILCKSISIYTPSKCNVSHVHLQRRQRRGPGGGCSAMQSSV